MSEQSKKRHPWQTKHPSEDSLEDQMCYACGQPAKYSILLAHGPQGKNHSSEFERLYIPNQTVRSESEPEGLINEYWFCHPCMRFIEDNMRASILYLQAETGTVSVDKT